MVNKILKPDQHYGDPEAESCAPYRGHSPWGKVKDVLIAELYSEFVPRWFKKLPADLPYAATIAHVGWVTTSLKLGAAIGSYALLVARDLGDYAPIVGSVATYLAADFSYQILDLIQAIPKVKKAATLAVDLVSYPFYLLSSRSQNARSARRG